MSEYRLERWYVEPILDDEGWETEGGYHAWFCACGEVVRRYRGQGDVSCHGCDQPFNAFGQRLRRDYASNRSMYDEDVSDMDGYEMQHAGDDW